MPKPEPPATPSSIIDHRSSFPLVSVLLAIRNEAPHLPRCLDALAAQTWPRDRIEVIVADGCSEDGSAAVARGYMDGLNLTVVENPARNTPSGFNRALVAARGEVVIILGARAEVAPDFIERSVAALDASGADAAGGVVESLPMEGKDTPTARAVALALRSPFGVGGARYRYADTGGWVDTVNYGAYRRAVFQQIGGFDEMMTWVEDDEFNYRLRAAGGRLWLDPAIRVRYQARPTLAALWRQQFRWGYNKPKVARRHPAQMRPRHAVPALFVTAVLAGTAASPLLRPARLLLGGVLGAYVLAAVGASVLVIRREGTTKAGQTAGAGQEPAAGQSVATKQAAQTGQAQGPAPTQVPTDAHPTPAPSDIAVRLSSSRSASSILLRLPLAFATMHVAYGSGMLLGLLRGLPEPDSAGQGNTPAFGEGKKGLARVLSAARAVGCGHGTKNKRREDANTEPIHHAQN